MTTPCRVCALNHPERTPQEANPHCKPTFDHHGELIPRCREHRKHTVLRECARCGCARFVRNDKRKQLCRCLNGIPENTSPVQPEPAAEPVDPASPIIIKLERENLALRDDLHALRAKLKAAHREESSYQQLAALIRENLAPLPAVNFRPPANRESALRVDAIATLSDEHCDQVISRVGTWGLEQYNFDIFRCRLERWVNVLIKYSSLYLPRHQVDRLWIFKLGDSVQGDIHFAKHRNSFPNSLKAALAAGDVEAHAIQALLPYYPGGVHVVAVSGNHPRMCPGKKDYVDPHDNLDFLVATQIATRLENEIGLGRVTVHAPQAWSAFVDVRGHLCCLNHGDDVRGFAGFPWYGFSRKNNRVQSLVAQKNVRVKYFFYGHWHTAIPGVPSADTESIHAGNWSLTDPYAAEALAVGNTPKQNVFLVDDEYGIVMDIPIFVRDDRAEEKFRAGEWEPQIGRSLVVDEVCRESAGFQVVRV